VIDSHVERGGDATSKNSWPNAASRLTTRPCRRSIGSRWFVEETYVKVAGKSRYVYRATDEQGQLIDVFVSPRRNIPDAFHNTDQYANNRVECDHGRLKARLRPMR